MRRFADAFLGEMLDVKIPVNLNRSQLRTTTRLPIRCLWASINNEINADPSIMSLLSQSDDTRPTSIMNTPKYMTHPDVVRSRQAGETPPLPLAVYIDGVRYVAQAAGRSESVVGFWVENLLTSRRHFLCGFKSNDACGCGCRGWCSIQPVLSHITWQLEACQKGVVPSTNLDGTPYEPASAGGMVAQSPLAHKACLVWVKGDWSEHQHTLGLTGWASTYSCCQYCHMDADEIKDRGVECCTLCPDWTLRTEDDYDASCRQCEINVTIKTKDDLKMFMRSVRWHKPKKGVGGRVVFRDCSVGGTDLKAGDRIEPSLVVPDIGQVQNLDVPSTITLWRARTSHDGKIIDSVSRRCPLFSSTLHCNPVSSLAIDSLHTVALGVCQRFVSACIWRVLLRNPWNIAGDLTSALDTEINYVKADLNLFQSDPENKVDRNRAVASLTLKMLGKRGMFNFQDMNLTSLGQVERDGEWVREGKRDRERRVDRQRDTRSAKSNSR
jgi:hypothetical protein